MPRNYDSGIIYKVTSPSGKVYIGQTVRSLAIRKKAHLSVAWNKNSPAYNRPFSSAIRKYGDQLVWEILESSPIDRLNELEVYYIDYFKSFHTGYNTTLGGRATHGFHHKDQAKCRMSAAHKNKILSADHKLKIQQSCMALNKLSRPVIQFDLNGLLIIQHKSTKQAALWIKNNTKFSGNTAEIRLACCSNKIRYGYRWSYVQKL